LVDLTFHDALGYHAVLDVRVHQPYECNPPEDLLGLTVDEDGACTTFFMSREDAEKLARLIIEQFQIDLTPEEPAPVPPEEPAPEVDAW
jgi:hypothetical protein